MTKLRFLLLLWPSLAFAQTPDTLRAHYHYQRADSLEHAYYHDSAFAHFQRAAGGYYLAGAWDRYVRCLNRQVYCQYKVGRYGASLALAQYALRFSTDSLGKYHAETADAYAGVGDGYEGKEQYDSALLCYQKSLAINRTLDRSYQAIAVLKRKVGQAYCSKGVWRNATLHLHDALQLVRQQTDSNHEHLADIYAALAYLHLEQYLLDSAAKYQEKALAIARQYYGEHHPALISYYGATGYLLLEQSKYSQAKRIFLKALSLVPKRLANQRIAMWPYVGLGMSYQYQYQYQYSLDSALLIYQKVLTACSNNTEIHSSYLSAIYNNIGVIYSNKGWQSLALDYLHKALAISEQEPDYDFSEHFNIAATYEDVGAYEMAMSYYESALYNEESNSDKQHPNIADAYYGCGSICMKTGDYRRGIEYLQEAVQIYLTIYPKGHMTVADIYCILGEIYQRKKDYRQAMVYYQKAIAMAQNLGQDTHPHVADYHHSVGEVYRAQGRYQLAHQSYLHALSLCLKAYVNRSFILNSLATLHEQQSLYDSALFYYQESIDANAPVSDTAMLSSIFVPTLINCKDAPQLLTALHGQASTLQARYQQTDNLADWQVAQRCYRAGDSLVAQMRQTYLKYSDRIAFSKTTRQMYHDAIGSSLARPQSGDTEAAFYFAERSKAGALTLALADRRAKHFAGVPDTLLTQEKQLQQERTFYRRQEQEAQQQEDRVRQQYVEDRRFALNRRYDSLVQTMERRFPRYHTLKYGTRVRRLSEVRARLDARTALLEYVLGDTVGYVFGVSQRRDTVLQFVVDSSLHRQLHTLRTTFTPDSLSVVGQAASDYASVAYRVYRRLLAPVLATLPPSVDRLVVVPDGALSYLPFDMLLTEPVRHRRYRQWPYLLRHYALSYAYSATLQWPDARPAPQQSPVEADDSSGSPRLLALAPAYEGVQRDTTAQRTLGEWRDAVVPLAWNQHEVANLRRYLPGTFVAGDAAQEATFKDQTDGHTVVHLAAHALLDEEDPMQSRLVFSTPTDSTEDGFLHAYELYGMDIPARLAVLSACHTGSGRLAEGEGLMSLARAFAYAGCPSVVMNRWAAHDATTSRVMDRLYYYLAEGYDKADALRQAKLDFLAQARGAAQFPAYWGGWMLVGDRTPLMSPSRNPGWVVLLLVLVGGGVGWWVWAQRREVMR